MRKLLLFILAAGVCISSSVTAAAEDAPKISVKAELNNAFITIGQPVEYTVTVRHAPSIQLLTIPPIPLEDVLSVKKIDEFKREENGVKVTGRKIILTAFRLGEFILPSVTIDYREKDGPVQSIETQKIFLTVKSVAEGEEKTDIRGIKSVIALESEWKRTVVVALGSVVALIIFWVVYRRLRKKQIEGASAEPEMTPEQAAFFELNKLFDSDLIRKGRTKDYYLRLSEILKTYFEKRFEVLALEATTDEVIRNLNRKDVDRTLVAKISEVLSSADLAKFAKWIPDPPQIILINKKSKEIIEESAPRAAVTEVRDGV